MNTARNALSPAQPGHTAAALAVVRTYESFEAASAAREALLGAGFAAAQIDFKVMMDEAGPVQGNFVIGNGVTTHGGPPSGVLAGPEVPYEENFSQPAYRGAYLLGVRARSDDEHARALDILQPFGGVDPDAAAAA